MPDGVKNNPIIRDDTGAAHSKGQASSLRGVSVRSDGARRTARIFLLVVLALSAAGCGDDKPQVEAGQTLSQEELKQKCADPQWRDKNLGIWYAVCRQPIGW